ncbi:MAG TPA: porin family protein [Gemmatimonadota bacterium]|nr:porin family protein [Gemmatimonadota bacterium]
MRPRILLVLLILSSLALAVRPRALNAQGSESLVLIGLEPLTGALVPVDMELVRRPGELRLDPQAGTLSVVGAVPEPAARAALLGLEPTTGALVAVDLRPVRRPGAFTIDPRSGTLTAEGLVAPSARVEGPILIGLSGGTGALVPMAVELAREPGSYAIDPRPGVLSPSPRDPALLGFDPVTGSLVPVRLALIRGQGGVSVDPATRRLSRTGAPPAVDQASETLTLLGTHSDAGGLVAVDLDLVQRGSILTLEPATGALLPSQPGVEAAGADELNNLGAHSITGALGRVEVEAVPIPGEYAVGPTGILSPVGVSASPTDRETGGLVFGAGLDLRQMLKLQDVLEQVPGSTGADAGKLAPGIHGFAEYAWRALSLGIEAAYAVTNTDVQFPHGLQTGDLTYSELGGNAKITLPFGESVRPYATAAILRSWSKGDFEIEGLSEERTHNTTRAGMGAGLDYWALPHLGLRFEALYITTFEDNDAGEHVRWRVGAMFSPGGSGGGRDVD